MHPFSGLFVYLLLSDFYGDFLYQGVAQIRHVIRILVGRCYVHGAAAKIVCLMLNAAVCWTAWAAGSFCILMVALKGGGAF